MAVDQTALQTVEKVDLRCDGCEFFRIAKQNAFLLGFFLVCRFREFKFGNLKKYILILENIF